MRTVKSLTTKLDVLASEIERERPDLALAIDLISDRIEKMAWSSSMNSFFNEYKSSGGTSTFDDFIHHDFMEFLKDQRITGKIVAEWQLRKEKSK
jgi:hypothetical protein